MAARILIIEDEQDLLNTVVYNLEQEGFTALPAPDGAHAKKILAQDPPPDLVLLDLMLPDVSGKELCRHIRQNKRTKDLPVIMVTAKGDEIDRVVGFEVGADDYVVKPFSVRELILRIKAVLRRRQPEKDNSPEELKFGLIRIDLPGHRVWLKDEELQLTALEFKLLTTLISRKGRVQTRDVLLSDVWGIEADVTTRTVDTHVKRLREKLGPAGHFVETIRGVGYRFASSQESK